MGLVGVVEPHLPAPAAFGGEQHGAAAAVVFGDQQRLGPLARRRHFEQRGSAGFGLADILVVGDLRNLLPPFGVARGIFVQAAEDALGSLRGERDAGKIAMEGAAAFGQPDGNEVGHGGILPAAIAQRSASADEEHAAAAPVHEIVNRLLLRRGEVAGLHAADDQALIRKQLFGLGREAVLEFFGILDALPVDLVLRGAQHARQFDADIGIVFDRAADELVLPNRFALYIEDAGLARFHVDHAGDLVIELVLFAAHGVDRDLQGLGTGRAAVEDQILRSAAARSL